MSIIGKGDLLSRLFLMALRDKLGFCGVLIEKTHKKAPTSSGVKKEK